MQFIFDSFGFQNKDQQFAQFLDVPHNRRTPVLSLVRGNSSTLSSKNNGITSLDNEKGGGEKPSQTVSPLEYHHSRKISPKNGIPWKANPNDEWSKQRKESPTETVNPKGAYHAKKKQSAIARSQSKLSNYSKNKNKRLKQPLENATFDLKELLMINKKQESSCGVNPY